ncbi:hypothetical protein P8C59_000805 [Phyllachora maydis]|uniref:Dihydroorotate dehydrogenase (quinone), mitochondrial n=1 Tax=Phyllachora maydis TaxID=1825666 RepID=A0AAD9MBK6_9PEZI|nr:hypothetical protein P8C59_000805 [Phyllachora maydis]
MAPPLLFRAFLPRRALRDPRFLINCTSKLGIRAPWRPASTSSSAGQASPLLSRLRIYLLGGSFAASVCALYIYVTDTRASFHRWLVPPLLRFLFPDAEDAHHAGTAALETLYALHLHPRERAPIDGAGALTVDIFGTRLANPVGVSAGLDKDAAIPDALFALGAAVVEVGGVTPRPQAGNPRPRVFRVPGLAAMVNRYGLNSGGADAVAARLRDRLRRFARAHGLTEREVRHGEGPPDVPVGGLAPGRLLLVQIAKNKDTDEKDVEAVVGDYVYCVNRLAPYADVLVVNVSSPNTPGLRDLQATKPLTSLLAAVVDEARRADRKVTPRVMVKVSPDEDDESQMDGVVEAVWASGVDGVIVGNTTKRRTGLVPPGVRLAPREQQNLMEEGGFSGPAMFGRTLELVQRYRNKLDKYSYELGGKSATADSGVGAVPETKVLFATGGITNGEQALQILTAGASVAMVYTGLKLDITKPRTIDPSSASSLKPSRLPASPFAPDQCAHTFQMIKSESTMIQWLCASCHSGPHWIDGFDEKQKHGCPSW